MERTIEKYVSIFLVKKKENLVMMKYKYRGKTKFSDENSQM